MWKIIQMYYLILLLSFQVPLLLSIGEEEAALTKATESGDTDLVYFVLFHIWQKVSLPYPGNLQHNHLSVF